MLVTLPTYKIIACIERATVLRANITEGFQLSCCFMPLHVIYVGGACIVRA